MSEAKDFREDDAAAIAWLFACIAEAGDVYVRPLGSPATLTTSLRDELGIDSIGLVSVLYAILDALGADADESEVVSFRTVGDVVRFARRLTAEAP